MRDKILFIYAIAVLLGIIVGFVGSLFMLTIDGLHQLMVGGLAYARSRGWSIGIVSSLLSMVMVFMAWLMVKYIASEATGSGVPEIEGALLNERGIFWRRLLPVKFIGGALAISSNLVLGREGPTIQMGGNLGAMLAEGFHLSHQRRDSLIAAGAAAGLATAFNAPLAGILFVLEEMRRAFDFSFVNFKVVSICCVCATIVLHLIIGAQPVIAMSVFMLPNLSSLWLFFLFGIIVGFVGVLFNRVLMKSLYGMDKLSASMHVVYVIMVGLLVGYLAYRWPAVVGGGYDIIDSALTLRPSFLMLLSLVVVRFVTGVMSYSAGVPGGIFAPMLALGTLLGLASSYILQWSQIDITVHPGMFAVAGMGGLFSAVVRAPITGIVLVVEMTQNYSLILPLMVTCLVSTTVMQLAGSEPIYTQMLNRTLKKQI